MERDRYNLDDFNLLAQVSQVFRSVSDTFTGQVDIPRGQATVLCVVALKDGVTQTEIAETLSVKGATVTNMLQHLEENGLVIRRRDPEDNRLVRVYVTEAGKQKEHSINEQFGSFQEQIFKGLSEAERSLMRQWLQRILMNITESG